MRKIKAENVRIGDFISRDPGAHGWAGKVEGITHLSRNLIDLYIVGGTQPPFTVTLAIGVLGEVVYRD